MNEPKAFEYFGKSGEHIQLFGMNFGQRKHNRELPSENEKQKLKNSIRLGFTNKIKQFELNASLEIEQLSFPNCLNFLQTCFAVVQPFWYLQLNLSNNKTSTSTSL